MVSINTVPAQQPARPAPAIRQPAEILSPLSLENPVFDDFNTGEARHYLLQVTEPGMFRIETSGLLAMSLTVRTALQPNLFQAKQNGIARNALVQAYLKPGEYLVNAQPMGSSKGRAGIHLRRTPLQDGGFLPHGIEVKNTIPADTVLRYQLKIEEAGLYRFQSTGLRTRFGQRIEDASGWPLLKPGDEKPIVLELNPGNYQYYSLASEVSNRRSTSYHRVAHEQPVRGKGPHPLMLNRPIDNIWIEDAEASPDIYQLELRSGAPLELTVHADLEAVVYGSDDREKARSNRGKWQGELPADNYRIEIHNPELNNHLPYSLRIDTPWLIPGVSQRLESLPGKLNVSLAKRTFASIVSRGEIDVRAELYDSEGKLVLSNDDAADDWNFALKGNLAPGRYQLNVLPLESGSSSVEVLMSVYQDRQLPVQNIPFTLKEKTERDILVIPLRSSTKDELVRFTCRGPGHPQLSLSRDDLLIGDGKKELIAPLGAQADYKLYLWNDENIVEPITVQAELLAVQTAVFDRETMSVKPGQGVFLRSAEGFSLEVGGAESDVLFAAKTDQLLTPWQGEAQAVDPAGSWLFSKQSNPLRISALALQPQKPRILLLGAAGHRFILSGRDNQPMLVYAEMINGPLGISLASPGKGEGFERSWQGSYASPGLAVSAVFGRGPFQGQIWPADEIPFNKTTRRVRLQAVSFALTGIGKIDPEIETEGELPPGKALAFDAHTSVYLLMEQGLAAFTWAEGRCRDIRLAADSHLAVLLPLHNERFYLVNTADKAARYRITSTTTPPRDVLSAAQPFWNRTARQSGPLSLNVENPPGNENLLLIGSIRKARLLSRDGRIIYRQPDNKGLLSWPGLAGTLEMEADEGRLQAWFGPADNPLKNYFSGEPTNVQELKIEENGVLAVEVPAGCLAALSEKGRILDWAGTARKTTYLLYRVKPGQYEILCRASEEVSAEKIKPKLIQPRDWPGTEKEQDRLINVGEFDLIRFQVRSKSKVGTGVRSDSDHLAVALYDNSFGFIDQGPAMINDLEAGEYLLLIKGRDKPVRYQAVIINEQGSRREEPEDVRNQFLKREEER